MQSLARGKLWVESFLRILKIHNSTVHLKWAKIIIIVNSKINCVSDREQISKLG